MTSIKTKLITFLKKKEIQAQTIAMSRNFKVEEKVMIKKIKIKKTKSKHSGLLAI